MTLEDLLHLCAEHGRLGWAVAEQLNDVVLEGEDMADKNPNALKMCASFLRECAALGVEGADEQADAIIEHLKQVTA